MKLFVVPSLVMFHDTAAYGDRHFLTHTKLQCVIREHFLHENTRDASILKEKNEIDDVILLMEQGYCRNLSSVKVSQNIAILFSLEESTASRLIFCFRVIGHDGIPVSCGFQAVACLSSRTGAEIPVPPSIREQAMRMKERPTSPSFTERVQSGHVNELFDNDVISLGMAAIGSETRISKPGFVVAGNAVDILQPLAPAKELFPNGIIFLFPGQGSYSQKVLRDLYYSDSASAVLLRNADKITQHLLGKSILSLITAENPEQHDALLEQSPDLAQVGIYLGSVVVARYLMNRGVKPGCVAGHSAGELAALAIAGSYSDDAGVEIICHRVLSLQSLHSAPAGMLAVFCPEKRILSVIQETGCASLQIAVVNHQEQVVVSGSSEDLQSLKSRLKSLGIQSSRLRSRYPFHSTLLESAVAPFVSFLRQVAFTPPEIPVYSPIERDFYTAQSDMALLLASHFTRPFIFSDALRMLFISGGRIFIECGGGDVLGELARKVLTGNDSIKIHCPLKPGENVISSLNALITAYKEDLQASESRQARLITASAKQAGDAPAKRPSPGTPIAIVSRGCVLPGAENPREFWENILAGKSGIVDAGELRPDMEADFLSRGDVIPDKTYTLLGGFVRNLNPDITRLPYNEDEFSRLSSAQRFLAVAMQQCLADKASSLPEPCRIHLYLGSTGDGVIEYDEALLCSGLRDEVGRMPDAQTQREAFCEALDSVFGRSRKDIHDFAPFTSYTAVAEKFFGSGTKILCADAACASSLYAIDLGINALQRGECDVAFCGGVFSPGPANSCLFSQFRGLSATGSRPLDATADGVVFGEGAALLMLKRLPDAIVAGDTIHGVIRGSGLSNDGKSPSVAVPRKQGQIIALQRAYRDAGIPTESVQYIEAHATATPVGDAEEFGALKEVFSKTASWHGSVELSSVKGLIGHTGWLAGAASVIKMTEALNAKCIPPQNNFTSPNPNFNMGESPFRISTEARPWHENQGGEPRRVGVNGFGFGGSNAHLIMEEYLPAYHDSWGKVSLPTKRPSRVMSLVGIGTLFPIDAGRPAGAHSAPQFDRAALKLPKGFMILPDVLDHMDKGQLLAFLAAFDALKNVGDAWKSWKSSIGVVVGVEGKTGLGITANKRIYLDSLERRLNNLSLASDPAQTEIMRIKNALLDSLHSIQPSGPYTLPGIMPNVTAGRIGNLLDLNGPNFVIDSGGSTLFDVLSTAGTLLSADKAQMVLAGGISGYAGPEVQGVSGGNAPADLRPVTEGAIILVLVNPDFARMHKLAILAEFTVLDELDGGNAADFINVGEKSPYRLKGAEGAFELTQAIEHAGHKPIDLLWPPSRDKRKRILRVSAPAAGMPEQTEKMSVRGREAVEMGHALNPIYFCSPCLTPNDVKQSPEPHNIEKGRILILADEISWLSHPEAQAFINELNPTILCPASRVIENAIPIDLSSEDSIAQSMETVDFSKFGCVVAVKNLAETAPLDGVLAEGGSGGGLLDLMFAAVRKIYEPLKSGSVPFGSLSLNAPAGDHLHPYAGLMSGFVKAIARELPQALCKSVVTDAKGLQSALTQLRIEWARGPLPAPAEIIYKDSRRHEYTLRRLPALSSGHSRLLGPDSVVIASGGGRGVTAVLVEELLRAHGCTVVLLGRTRLTDVPPHLLSMSQHEFDAHETVFYREEMKRSPGIPIKDLKKRYEYFRNAREVQDTVSMLNGLRGTVEYLPVDITDGLAVDRAMKKIAERFGRVDLFIHGAGLQVSKNTARKKIEEFRRIIGTKIGGLGNLYRSYHNYFSGRRTHFHLVTSVFSYFGNDGQPDYGAANEAMNHIAGWMNASSTDNAWTSLAWLGWAGIGMTRGSEYEALARSRGLRPVTKQEGQTIFSDLLRGGPLAPASFLISEGEIGFYGVKLSDAGSEAPSYTLGEATGPQIVKRKKCDVFWDFSLGAHTYLRDHLVGGRPTYPGSFELELAAQAARELRPDLHCVFFDGSNLKKFIKFPSHSDNITLRGKAAVLSESGGNCVIGFQLLSDFVHSSGKILQKDIIHLETTVHMTSRPQQIDFPEALSEVVNGMSASDPYLSPDAFVRLKGFFNCLHNIEIGSHSRKGVFKIRETNNLPLISHFHTPSVMLDAILRFSMVNETTDGRIPVYVPLSCREVHIAPDINDSLLAAEGDEIDLSGTNPRIEGDRVRNDWIKACDRKGRVLGLLKDLVGLKVGEVSARKLDRARV